MKEESRVSKHSDVKPSTNQQHIINCVFIRHKYSMKKSNSKSKFCR